MKNPDLSQLRSAILKGMSVSAEKLIKQKAQSGRKLVVSDNGQVKLVSPDSLES